MIQFGIELVGMVLDIFVVPRQNPSQEQWNKGPGGCLGYTGDEILPSYLGITINHYKDPY